jgi:hypothetical protein
MLGIELAAMPGQHASESIGQAELVPQACSQVSPTATTGAKTTAPVPSSSVGLPAARNSPLRGASPLPWQICSRRPEVATTRWGATPYLVAQGLHQLDVLARPRRGDLHQHVVTVSPARSRQPDHDIAGARGGVPAEFGHQLADSLKLDIGDQLRQRGRLA